MKTPISRRAIDSSTAPYRRSIPTSFLTIAGLILAAITLLAATHPPFISWIPDQRNSSGSFAPQYFNINKYDDSGSVTVSIESTNPNFIPNPTVTTCATQPCVDNGTNYVVTFSTPYPFPTPGTTPATSVMIKAKAGTSGPMAYTSFTLRKDSAQNPPSIGNLPDRYIQRTATGEATYETMFVVGDLDTDGNEDIVCEDGDPNCICPNEPTTCIALDVTAHSGNTNLLPDSGITLQLMPPDQEVLGTDGGPRTYLLSATTSPSATPGKATVTVSATDKDGNVTETSFVIKTVANTNAEPTIKNEPESETFVEQFTSATSKSHSFKVTGATNLADLRVIATSSNTKLVPNANIVCSTPASGTGIGTVTITPVKPLPSPSPGVPQASTITLSVADDAYNRQTTFLYILAPGDGSPANGGVESSFLRPSGVYSLNARSAHRGDDSFLTGEMHGNDLTWVILDSADYETFFPNFFAFFPSTQKLSLNLQEEPCDIASTPGVVTWCDTNIAGGQYEDCYSEGGACLDGDNEGVLRAVPWDSYLRERRASFLQGLAGYLNTSGYMSKISVINVNLPGAETGIRNADIEFYEMEGYTRERLLAAIQDELRTVQLYFPGVPVQIGFFKATDSEGGDPGESELWQWLYRDATTDPGAFDDNGVHVVALFDEFNGVKQPRVSFFQETWAAARISVPIPTPTPSSTPTPTPTPPPSSSAPNYITPPSTAAYTFTPPLSSIPSFAYYPDMPSEQDLQDRYNNGITLQANTPWSGPAMEKRALKLIHTINGSPNDGMEAAFNNLLSQYLEVYLPDLDQANPPDPSATPKLNAELWAGQLQSWHDYTDYLRSKAPIEAPAGLTVLRTSATQNQISWLGVYGATSYNVERIDFGASSPSWVQAGCNPTSNLTCTDTASTGREYGYRVRARNATGSNITPWAYVAVFLSEGTGTTNYDGYVENVSGTKTAYNSATEPGIRAGQGASSDLKGFLSFNTTPLGSTAKVLGAKLRLKQTTNNAGFDTFGACTVDIRKGSFGNNPALQGSDFSVNANAMNVAQIIGVGGSNWVEADLSPDGAKNQVNTTDRTQFRLNFTHIDGVSNKFVGWNAGESTGNEPQLIVQYQ